MKPHDLCIFALDASRAFGERVVDRLDADLCEHEERGFEDGEHKARPLTSVRGKDVYVIQSLHGDGTQSVNDKLCRLLFFIGALRQASAKISVSSPGQADAVSYISCSSYMMPWVEYSGKITRSMPGRPTFMPFSISAMFLALSRTSALVCSRGIL